MIVSGRERNRWSREYKASPHCHAKNLPSRGKALVFTMLMRGKGGLEQEITAQIILANMRVQPTVAFQSTTRANIIFQQATQAFSPVLCVNKHNRFSETLSFVRKPCV